VLTKVLTTLRRKLELNLFYKISWQTPAILTQLLIVLVER
jgi:hypothetical protein